jgi:spore maturation protein CgeB
MNILVVGRKYTESFGMHISETSEYLGHNVYVYEPGIKAQQAKHPLQHKILQAKGQLFNLYKQTSWGRENEVNRLRKFLNGLELDLVICCHDFLSPIQVKWLKNNYNCKVVLWFPDAISNFGKAMFLDAEYDALFFKEPFVVEVLINEFGKNAHYLPECCNPFRHKKIDINEVDFIKYNCEITTAGNMHTARSAFFKNLQNYDVKIWGNPAPAWMDTNGIKSMIQNHFVSNEEKSKAFSCSKIVLNTMHPTEIFGVNVRLFEIAATGSFQICNYRKSINDLFVIDDEIVTFDTINELYEKIQFYINNSDLRSKIALNAYNRVIKDHTYEKRLKRMFEILNIA